MLQTDIVFSALAVLVAQGLTFSNLIRRGQFTLNRLFAALSFLSAFMFFVQFMQLLNFEFVTTTTSARIYFTMILFLSGLFFRIFQIYPGQELRPKLKYVLLPAAPGFVFIIITFFTDKVIYHASFKGFLDFEFGTFFPIYISIFIFYMLGSIFLIVYKSKFAIESKVLRQELRFISYGLIVVVMLLLLLVFFLPIVYEINIFRNIGITFSGILILIILNYATFDLRVIDFKIFNIKLVFWVIIFFILFTPIFFGMIFGKELLGNSNTAFLIVTVLSFVYLVIFFRFGKPRIENLFRREYLTLEKSFEEFFRSISQLTVADRRGPLWEEFYNKSIDEFINRFEISSAYFYLFDSGEGFFRYVHGVGPEIDKELIEKDSILVKNLNVNSRVLDTSIIYSDVSYSSDKRQLLEFYNKYGIEIAIPFYMQESGLIGILLLGYLPGNKLYSKTFLSALEIYRIQFQRLLANGLVLEKVRQNQVVEHDKMVVGGIKKKILPRELNSIEGIKISSFYMNNSAYGGDYYDSIKIGSDKIGIFISDSAYYGVESAILSLELFSAFHSRPRKLEAPDKILSVLNWVLTTSRLTKKYAPAFLMTYSSNGEINYSNAGFNPLIIFDTLDNEFHSYTTNGIPIGVDKDYKFESRSVKVSQGNIGIMFSNGFQNTINPEGEIYTIDRVKNVIKKNKYENASIIVRRVYQDLIEFIQNKKQTNDISLILFKI